MIAATSKEQTSETDPAPKRRKMTEDLPTRPSTSSTATSGTSEKSTSSDTATMFQEIVSVTEEFRTTIETLLGKNEKNISSALSAARATVQSLADEKKALELKLSQKEDELRKAHEQIKLNGERQEQRAALVKQLMTI